MAGSQLLKILLKLNIINELPKPEDLSSETGELIALANKGVINLADTLKKLAEFLGLQLVDLDRPEVFDQRASEQIIERLDQTLLWKHKCIPLKEDARYVTIAVADPCNHDAQQQLQFAVGKPLSIVLASEEQILNTLHHIAAKNNLPFDCFEEVILPTNVEVISGVQEDTDVSEGGGPDTPPIIRLSHKILADAIDSKASDIHFDPSQDSLAVRLRIDGVMHLLFELPKKVQLHITSRFKLLAGMDISERRRPQDGRFSVRYGKFPVDVRGSTVPTPFGEKMVFRVLVSDITKLSFSQLGTTSEMQDELLRVLGKRGKMLLVTGPTGSGKTTTLYTCLNYMRDGTNNIITVEDPIEYRIPGINQIQVNEAIGMTFAKTLRSILRQDPDVILVGEVRDAETARIAFQAAQTGHLVLSTLHTNDAPSALTRLLGIGIEEYIIASSLEGVVAQRLVRKVCTECAVTPDDQWLAQYADYIEAYQLDTSKLKIGKGCNRCRGAGLSGQMGVYSYLNVSESVSEKLRQKASIAEIVQQARSEGYRSIEDEAVRVVRDGLSSIDEVKPYLDAGEFLTTWRETKKRHTEHVRAIEIPVAEMSEKQSTNSMDVQAYHKPRILLIEDDSDMREILSLVLQKEMYEVIEAPNGRIGLEMLFNQKPNLILCDLMMPNMDGREFLKRIRSNPGVKTLPVIILTAVDSDENEIDLLDLGATDFVSKTDSTNVMLSRVRNALQAK